MLLFVVGKFVLYLSAFSIFLNGYLNGFLMVSFDNFDCMNYFTRSYLAG